jgi:hypothetical protein
MGGDDDGQGMEELEHDMVDEKRTPRESKNGSSSAGIGGRSVGCSTSSKKVPPGPACFRMMTVLRG